MEGDNMKNIMVRRFLAYFIDIFLVACVMYLISFIPLSRDNQKYYEEVSFQMNSLYDSYSKNEISENEFNEKYIPLYYEWNRSNMGNTIINLFCIVLYFGCVPFFLKGQTFGKKLFHLQIVSVNDDSQVGIVSYLVRAIILNNVLITIAQQGILSFMNANNYYSFYANVNLVGYVLIYFMLLLMFLRMDHRSLHDLIAGTKVISVSDSKDLLEVKKDVEEKNQEQIRKEKNVKKTSPKKSTSSKKVSSKIQKSKTDDAKKTPRKKSTKS